jgi:putative DNA primase/helicase
VTPLDAALALIARGWNPVPVEFRSKKPIGREWQQRVINRTNVEQFFDGADLNIGAMMGATSRGLTDVDLDCAEAITIAPYILTPTKAVFGRPSKRFSHYLYYTALAQTVQTAVVEFNDPLAKQQNRTDGRLVELRIGGKGLGAQTVVPPSTHPSTEQIRWEEDGEPINLDGGRLLVQVKTIAAYSLLARYWPQTGSGHHDTARVVGGFLARLGHQVPIVRSHVEGIARAAGSSRWKELSRTAADAAQAFQDGKRAFGLKGLRESFGSEVADKVSEWLDYKGKAPASVGKVTPSRPQIRRCDQPGYDAASGMLFKPNGGQFPPIPSHPSRDDAREALKALYNLLDGFPFLAAADRATAVAGLFTALDRRVMPAAPLHAFTAPAAGTGKSLLIDIFAVLATGRLMPVIAQGRTEEELEKRLGASLLAGDAMVSIDNCEAPLQSSLLCQALTQQVLNIRMLGYSRNVETPVNAAIYATGNNLQIAGDLTRRTLLCSLDAGCEHPELRTFETDVIETARDRRGRLVAAALTIMRAWHLAREAGERLCLPPFGSFDMWSRRIREPLVWLDAGDPCDTVIKVRANDPVRESLAAVLAQWSQHLGIGVTYTIQRIITEANAVTDFQAVLLAVGASNPGSTIISNVKLGRWLHKVDGRIVNGLVLRNAGIVTGHSLWRLDRA